MSASSRSISYLGVQERSSFTSSDMVAHHIIAPNGSLNLNFFIFLRCPSEISSNSTHVCRYDFTSCRIRVRDHVAMKERRMKYPEFPGPGIMQLKNNNRSYPSHRVQISDSDLNTLLNILYSTPSAQKFSKGQLLYWTRTRPRIGYESV